MATVTAQYRKNGGEVVAISLDNYQFTDNEFWGHLQGPEVRDGTKERDPEGNLRILGFAKFADPALNSIVNATQVQIDNFIVQEGEDEKSISSAFAAVQIGDAGTPGSLDVNRKQLKALTKAIVAEINEEKTLKWGILVNALRQLFNERILELAPTFDTVSQNDLITRLRELGGTLDDLTFQEIKQRYLNSIDRDD